MNIQVPDLISYVNSWNVVALKTQLAVRGPISKRMRTSFWTALTDKMAGAKRDYKVIALYQVLSCALTPCE